MNEQKLSVLSLKGNFLNNGEMTRHLNALDCLRVQRVLTMVLTHVDKTYRDIKSLRKFEKPTLTQMV